MKVHMKVYQLIPHMRGPICRPLDRGITKQKAYQMGHARQRVLQFLERDMDSHLLAYGKFCL